MSVCARACVYSCSAAKEEVRPCSQRDPQQGWDQANWSHCNVFLLFLNTNVAHTHVLHTWQPALIFIPHKNPFLQSWSYTAVTWRSESDRIQFTCPQVSRVKADVCVILNPALPAFLFKSLKGEREYRYSQGSDVSRCN